MAVPEEHKAKVYLYFQEVEAIEESLRQNFLNNGGTQDMLDANKMNFFKQADTVVKAKLGYSYYPWPF
jgi:hypothetical protein